eukprot:TRINITY_DN12629_c0_g1_i1.p1 TRINITY_DN12629_c0_g1~~TRINITY_DN12629_c0_g1_i1.p1  ORF type:complete len:756 (-),score=167.90 TRINITY_DN12629_c0_g1_i1:112-2379(-)
MPSANQQLKEGLSANDLATLFPFHLLINSSQKVIQFGPVVSKLVPNISIGEPIDRFFTITQPTGVTFAQAHESHVIYVPITLGLAAPRSSNKYEQRIRFIGQFHLRTKENNERQILYVGAPAVKTLKEVQRLGLAISDFAIHDQTKSNLFSSHASTIGKPSHKKDKDKEKDKDKDEKKRTSRLKLRKREKEKEKERQKEKDKRKLKLPNLKPDSGTASSPSPTAGRGSPHSAAGTGDSSLLQSLFETRVTLLDEDTDQSFTDGSYSNADLDILSQPTSSTNLTGDFGSPPVSTSNSILTVAARSSAKLSNLNPHIQVTPTSTSNSLATTPRDDHNTDQPNGLNVSTGSINNSTSAPSLPTIHEGAEPQHPVPNQTTTRKTRTTSANSLANVGLTNLHSQALDPQFDESRRALRCASYNLSRAPSTPANGLANVGQSTYNARMLRAFHDGLQQDSWNGFPLISYLVANASSNDVLGAIAKFTQNIGQLPHLLESMLRPELEGCLSPDVLFREESTFSKFAVEILKMEGQVYLKRVLANVITQIIDQPDIHLDTTLGDFSKDNAKTLVHLAEKLLDELSAQTDAQSVPFLVTHVLNLVSKHSRQRFPESELQSVSNLFLLRLLCPALIFPEKYHLTSRTPTSRRTATSLVKMIHNLLNNSPPGPGNTSRFYSEANRNLLVTFLQKLISLPTEKQVSIIDKQIRDDSGQMYPLCIIRDEILMRIEDVWGLPEPHVRRTLQSLFSVALSELTLERWPPQ